MSTPATDPRSPDATPTVTVRGEAVLRTEPDEATMWITLSALENDPGKALGDVSRHSERSPRCLTSSGSKRRTARRPASPSTRSSITRALDADHSATEPLLARVSARLTDPELIGGLIARATTELQARIDGPRWQIAAQNPIRLEAAREAAADGQRKAQAFAEGAGAKLGRLIRLIEPDAEALMHRSGLRPMAIAEAAGGHQMPIEPGEHEVSAAVDITFTLELT